jgi:hypothetical protein
LPKIKQYAAAERVGRGHRKVLNHEYWDRAYRAVWKGDIKIIWDSQHNIARYHLDSAIPNKQILDTKLDTIPRWAENQFDFGINRLINQNSYFEQFNGSE